MAVFSTVSLVRSVCMCVFSWLFVRVCTLRSAHLLPKPQRPELFLLAEPKVPSAGSLPVLQPFLKKKTTDTW